MFDSATIASIGSSVLGGISAFGGSKNKHLKEVYKKMFEQLGKLENEKADVLRSFGELDKNLSDYYNNLSAKTYLNRDLTNIADEFNDTLREVKKSYAQRGLDSSGLEDSSLIDLQFRYNQLRAQTKSTAGQRWTAEVLPYFQHQTAQVHQYNDSIAALLGQTPPVAAALDEGAEQQTRQQIGALKQIGLEGGINNLFASSSDGGAGNGVNYDNIPLDLRQTFNIKGLPTSRS